MKGDDMSILESTAQRLLDTLSDSLDASADPGPRHRGARRVAYMAEEKGKKPKINKN